MQKNISIDINAGWCKGCEICVDVCPKQVLAMEDFIEVIQDLEACTGCMLCENLCPDFAIEVKVEKGQKSELKNQ